MQNQKKYRIEKVLHELIRDLPEAQKVSRLFDRGCLTTDCALEEIAEILKRVREEKTND